MNVILLPADAFDGTQAIITDTEQRRHITAVLGAQVGDTLKIAKLDDKLGTGVITSIGADKILLNQVCCASDPPPKLPLTVILALPRPKVLRRLISDMTALGVTHIVLINSYRTDKSYWSSPLLAHIDDFVQLGLAQAKDSIAPKITLAKRLKPFVQDELPKLIDTADGAKQQALVAHPYAQTTFGAHTSIHGLPTVLIVGAEGGFIPYEIELFMSVGAVPVSLGARILRTESAVSALVGRWLA